MELTELLRTRKIVPGTMLLIVLVTVLRGWWSWSQIWSVWTALAATPLVWVLGSLYRSLLVRESLHSFVWDEPIRQNIADRLIGMIRSQRSLSLSEEQFLRGELRLMPVFYYFIDRDESLKQKGHRVRDNGAKATSYIDVGLISVAGYGAHVVLALTLGRYEHTVLGLSYFCLWLLSFAVLFPMSIKRHLELSNDQLDYIHTHYRPAVCERAESILLDMP